MKEQLKYLSVIAAVSAALSGCGTPGKEGEASSGKSDVEMNMQEAAEHADAMLDAVLESIKPEVQWTHDETTTTSCDLIRRRTVMTIISKERRGSFLGLVERFWEKSGYEITAVNKSTKFPAVYAEDSDGFTISLSIGDQGQAFFEAATPCVEESAVADPTSSPKGVNYAGKKIPRPNVHSDFWSSTTPIPSASPTESAD
ncbi:hypothetical protein ACSR0Z_33105 [Streptomyces viridosporus]|uniref:Lipoprotein n=1 Tax=Streptomyces viridosporus T7A TaxID=665577 RepID=A0ABX6ALJ2_STRVD|nr:hypothetical protein [Streptomyces viridosporus]QEU88739.1 hypothetical protein CP969_31645 [Streptomyces viridosporus T7A]